MVERIGGTVTLTMNHLSPDECLHSCTYSTTSCFQIANRKKPDRVFKRERFCAFTNRVVSSEWLSLTTNDDIIIGITAEFTMFLVTANSKILIGNFSFCPSHLRLYSPMK